MYIVGQEEIDAIAKVIREGSLFRYGVGGECDRFEQRYAAYLGTSHVALTCSGTYALTAAVLGLGIGPGDEVLVPAHTYMATAIAVLATGAIPVIVDIDETITIDPQAVEDAIGPRTKAVVPVHMWGAACDMDAIMEIAARHDLLVLEDTCQGIGGGYDGRKLGTIGHAGAFSFNYYKNMTAGEGGAVCTDDARIADRVKCAIDPCHTAPRRVGRLLHRWLGRRFRRRVGRNQRRRLCLPRRLGACRVASSPVARAAPPAACRAGSPAAGAAAPSAAGPAVARSRSGARRHGCKRSSTMPRPAH